MFCLQEVWRLVGKTDKDITIQGSIWLGRGKHQLLGSHWVALNPGWMGYLCKCIVFIFFFLFIFFLKYSVYYFTKGKIIPELTEVSLWERKIEAATEVMRTEKRVSWGAQLTSLWCNEMTWDSRERSMKAQKQVMKNDWSSLALCSWEMTGISRVMASSGERPFLFVFLFLVLFWMLKIYNTKFTILTIFTIQFSSIEYIYIVL